MAILNNSNAISSGGYDINNSLRFRSSASAYLNRTPASAGNRQKWTWSAWVKRGTLGGASNVLFNCYNTASSTQSSIEFATDTLVVFSNDSSAVNINLVTTQVFRDPSAWYHLVVAVDTTQATAANRIKLYVNGNQITAFGTSTYPSQNYNTHINTTALHTTFATRTPSGLTDGYLAENNFIDGQALTPSSFGETDTDTGAWKPKAYTGTYGTNGFYLKFSDIATTSGSNAGLGKDFSGNTNYWTTNNISVTAGTTYDAMIDSPTLTSATVANYAVMSPLAKYSGVTASGGNLNVTSSTTNQGIAGTIYANSGKFYAEFTCNSNGTEDAIGILQDTYNFQNSGFYQATQLIVIRTSGTVYYSSFASISAPTWVSGDIVQVKLDLDNQTVGWAVNGGSYTTINITSYDSHVAGQYWTFGVKNGTAGASGSFNYSANFGQRPFSYTPPTGFVRLNTYNLPDSTIKKGNTVMDATTYTGTGANGRQVTNSGGFEPGMIWIKNRSSAVNHIWQDTTRGVGASNALRSDTTGAESGQFVDAVNSTGYVVNGDSAVNGNGSSYVGWQWRTSSSTVTNTNGSISSQVRANATAGFSVVTYTGTGANATVGHGLGVAPKWFFIKARGAAVNWTSYHEPLGNTAGLHLNTTGGSDVNSGFFNNTSPTSTTFAIGSGSTVNTNGGTYVAYCWAEIAGFSKFGSYTGNGSADGPFVYTGFRPKWILIKSSSGVSSWILQDTSRNIYNAAPNRLFPNTSDAEGTSSAGDIDILSNGFKIRNTSGSWNTNGDIYIYMAFAESPFKNSNAR
jgi:hypothetical protein